MSEYSIWHYTLDALPSVGAGQEGKLTLRLVIGTWGLATEDQPVSVSASYRANGQRETPPVLVQKVTQEQLAGFDGKRPDKVGDRVDRTYVLTRCFTNKDPANNKVNNTYFEAEIEVPAGTEVSYMISGHPRNGGAPITLGPYRSLVALPKFTAADTAGGRLGSPTWLAYLATERVGGRWLTHIRLDLDDISAGDLTGTAFPPIPVALLVDGRRLEVDPGHVHYPGVTNPQLPFIDWAADRITVTLAGRPDVGVDVNGRIVELTPGTTLGATRLLIEHFAIQGINDLLEQPVQYAADDDSSPPDDSSLPCRTYAQVTMRDELGKYSSRPDTKASGADGYSYGFDAHRRFAAPYEIAFNGGVLLLMDHDCQPADGWIGDSLETLKKDMDAGLLHPTVAGYGSHRVPYYSAETNRRDIDSCRDLELQLLGDSRPVFYPDQRLYRRSRSTRGMFDHTGIKYVVLDSDTGFSRNAGSIVTNQNGAGLDLSANHLWQDTFSKTFVLFIDDALKDAAAASGSYDYPKPSVDLRRRLLSYTIDAQLGRNLLVYGDDFEKACGNGWFEASGTNQRFFAFLEWVSGHQPWLQLVTTDDLEPRVDCVGTIDVRSSTDPLLGYAEEPVPERRDVLQFDYWEAAWADYPALWVDSSLGEQTIAVERALLRWPRAYRNELYEIAWLAFLTAQHENAWNKAPINFGQGPNAVRDPEDFTIVEGLQVRNTFVWLKASVWAAWAADPNRAVHHSTHDPVGEKIARLTSCFDDAGWAAEHWDADPLETYVLYNERALAVLDRNGGRITHAFVMDDDDGRPRAVSGTFKAYQFRASDGVECDGPVLQNTVWTPNHRYLAADLGLDVGPRNVTWIDNRPFAQSSAHELRLPDNFNAYKLDESSNDCTAVMKYNPGGAVNEADDPISQQGYVKLLEQDRSESPIVWHQGFEFTKTFTLDETKIRVDYDIKDVPGEVRSRMLVDNEFCVDLLAGATGRGLLVREATEGTVTVRWPGGAGAAITELNGCEFDRVSNFINVSAAAAKTPADVTAFLGVHRVLTEAVQVKPINKQFSFAIDLNAGGRPQDANP